MAENLFCPQEGRYLSPQGVSHDRIVDDRYIKIQLRDFGSL